eukprot:scpid34160/ scgid3064/ AP-1 complex subunit gamma-1; Adapter-related protein complex 1 subunit gamma-1; Adaptor protein complex AP-1 subunit gamma-1; Clathrin assembly protein complex 1 gamma-1 large chain; Gamma1-adaptin; Golgi adaptor HA1/AP1 adaptin subunit gamma-1
MAPTVKVRDLIRQIRAAKTAADERAVITKECANIRSQFRDEDNECRSRNVAKLLYIHMLGYPAHFGQLECLKLIASPKFSDKRIGYLGAMLLLDERQDVHLLVTNSLKNDIGHSNQFVAGLALSALGSICSQEMSRDLAGEIEKLLKSQNVYLKKKALLCARRIVQKVPELMEMFIPHMRSMLQERNHGVLVGTVSLITEMCLLSVDVRSHFRKQVSNLVRTLKSLSQSGFSSEHDVGGIGDPFLQIKIIRLLRILGRGDADSSDSMNDILAQVATNTESSKNVGHAILYESVLCIMEIRAEGGLRVLAVNILGRFLLNTDKNVRYVALNTLLRTVSVDNLAVQRHRSTILDCLKDPDISIRKRALDLSLALCNESNIRGMMKELLAFLGNADMELKTKMVTELLSIAEKYSPNKRWHIETMLQILELAPAYVREETVPSLIALVMNARDLSTYAVMRLFTAVGRTMVHQSLTQVAAWCIGEYGDLLVSGQCAEDEPIKVSEGEVLGLVESILTSPHSNLTTQGIALMCLMKLSTRFDHASLERIRSLIAQYGQNMEVELQQRSCEFTHLFSKFDAMRAPLLERMPAVEMNTSSSTQDGDTEMGEAPGPVADAAAPSQAMPASVAPVVSSAAPPAQEASLLDLLGDSTPAAPPSAPASTGGGAGGDLLDILGGLDLGGGTPAQQPAAPAGGGLLDLLGGGSDMSTMQPAAPAGGGLLDLLGGGSDMSTMQPAGVPAPAPAGGGLMDLLGGGDMSTMQPAAQGGIPPMTAYEKGGLRVVFTFEKVPNNPNNIVTVTATTTSALPTPLTDYTFLVAVPKVFQLNVQQASGNVVPPNNSGSVTQVVQVANPQRQPLRMRLRLQFTHNGQPVVETSDVNNFPTV